jgi:hypothetical protein
VAKTDPHRGVHNWSRDYVVQLEDWASAETKPRDWTVTQI